MSIARRTDTRGVLHNQVCPGSSSLRLALAFGLLSLLRLLLVFTQRLCEQLLELSVLKLFLRLDELGLIPHWGLGDQGGTGGKKGDGEVECSNECASGSVAGSTRISDTADSGGIPLT